MAAPTGNQNARKERTRVPVALSISDEKERNRLSWAIKHLQIQGVKNPTQAEIIRFVKDFCYNKIDEAISQEQ